MSLCLCGEFRTLEPGSVEALHLWIEASRLAFADRAQYVADPAFVDVPWDGLLASDYVAQRRALIRPDRALGRYEARGHRLRVLPGNPGANAGAIVVWPQTGRLHGGEEAYSDGVAAGYST